MLAALACRPSHCHWRQHHPLSMSRCLTISVTLSHSRCLTVSLSLTVSISFVSLSHCLSRAVSVALSQSRSRADEFHGDMSLCYAAGGVRRGSVDVAQASAVPSESSEERRPQDNRTVCEEAQQTAPPAQDYMGTNQRYLHGSVHGLLLTSGCC